VTQRPLLHIRQFHDFRQIQKLLEQAPGFLLQRHPKAYSSMEEISSEKSIHSEGKASHRLKKSNDASPYFLASRLPIYTYIKGRIEFMITIKKILVPMELSTLSVPAIGYASSLARNLDAEVILLHIVPMESLKQNFGGGYGEGLGIGADTPGITPQTSVEHLYQNKQQIMLGFLDQKIGPGLRQKVKFRPLVRLGKITDEIIAAAKEEQCDLIVMTGREGSLRRLFGASVTERVVRHAPCPVLSMRPSAQVRTEKDERLQVSMVDRWAA
jgi:nucleotide-binding universal stress UspA family protein